MTLLPWEWEECHAVTSLWWCVPGCDITAVPLEWCQAVPCLRWYWGDARH